MRVLVCGGRNYNNKKRVYEVLDDLYEVSIIIEGGARGADSLARSWAINRGVVVHHYPADWDKYGKAAGYIRNKQMLNEGKPNLVIAFPGGKGTQNMIELSNKAGITVMEIK